MTEYMSKEMCCRECGVLTVPPAEHSPSVGCLLSVQGGGRGRWEMMAWLSDLRKMFCSTSEPDTERGLDGLGFMARSIGCGPRQMLIHEIKEYGVRPMERFALWTGWDWCSTEGSNSMSRYRFFEWCGDAEGCSAWAWLEQSDRYTDELKARAIEVLEDPYRRCEGGAT